MFAIATASGLHFASYRAHPSLLTFSGSWDASAYRTIAEHGYPGALPRDDAGRVLPNVWSFLPLFPLIVRGVMTATGGSFWAAGVIVSAVCGGVAVVALHRLVGLVAGETSATRATLLFAFGPLGFLLQVSYAESMFLALLFSALIALRRRRHATVAMLGVAAAFTRPGALALAVAIAVHVVARFLARARSPFPTAERARAVAAGLVVAAAGLAWPVIAAHATGVRDAYTATELSWWTGYVGRQHFVPLTPWFLMASTWLGPAGVALVIVVLIASIWWFRRRSVRALGPETAGFAVAYWAYLVAVFLPQQSLPRLLMPMAPLLGARAFTATRRRTTALLVTGMALQPVAIVLLWFLGYP